MYCNFIAGLRDEDKLYTIERNLGLLMVYNLNTFSYKILVELPWNIIDESIWDINPLVKVEDVIYITFAKHDFLVSYDLKSGELRKYGVDYKEKKGVERCIFYNNKLWMIPKCSSKEIQVFDILSETFEPVNFLKEQLLQKCYITEDKRISVITNDEEVVYMTLMHESYIIMMNLFEKEIYVHNINCEDKISCISYDGKHFWISFIDNCKIAKWDIEKGIQEIIEVNDFTLDEWQNPIMSVYERNNIMCIVPIRDKKVCSYNKKDGKVSLLYAKQFKRDRCYKMMPSYKMIIVKDNLVIMFPSNANKILIVNLDNGELREIKSFIENDILIKNSSGSELLKKEIKERDWFDLTEFLGQICNKS